jgi:hypothetical protein
MKTLLFSLAFISLLTACNKNQDDLSDPISAQNEISGTYSGTFQRTGMGSSGVVLMMGGGRYEGTSTISKYPAICHGSYTAAASSITFKDSCNWTADFDWTLILDGTYNLERFPDGGLRIWRTTGSVTDEYVFDRPTR